MSYSTAYSSSYATAAAPPPPVAGPLTQFRLQVAAALEVMPEVVSGEWVVLDAPVDALAPPCFMVDWGPDPWGTVDTVCTDTVQLEVLVIGGRVGPENNYPTVEAMVDGARVALAAARLRPWQWLAPGPLEVAQLTYLTARLSIRQPVTVGGAP